MNEHKNAKPTMASRGAYAVTFIVSALIVRAIFVYLDDGSSGVIRPTGQDEIVRLAIEQTAQSFPMMLDGETRIDTAFATPGTMNYKYTLVNYNVDEIDFTAILEAVEQTAINSYCTHPDIAIFRNNDVPMKYHYFGKDGAFIGAFEANVSKCF